ncbi:hypothetical protein KCP73_18405 [Salmonella enterica subsp. enterica]|nr:hypothetical protein KCP73_18405 [Salmonella enterica subsp. enterica]
MRHSIPVTVCSILLLCGLRRRAPHQTRASICTWLNDDDLAIPRHAFHFTPGIATRLRWLIHAMALIRQ